MYGEIGSTFPLLLIDDTMLCRTGFVADIFATGCRPLARTSTNATTAAKPSSKSVQFLNFLSINGCNLSLAHHKRCATPHPLPAAPDALSLFNLLADFLWRSPANLKSIRSLPYFSTRFPCSISILMRTELVGMPPLCSSAIVIECLYEGGSQRSSSGIRRRIPAVSQAAGGLPPPRLHPVQ